MIGEKKEKILRVLVEIEVLLISKCVYSFVSRNESIEATIVFFFLSVT